ncbi:MAG: hypothetical protein RLZZ263_331 [Cyanobacteriota bacterium]|jgi:uncharacterized membrane protein
MAFNRSLRHHTLRASAVLPLFDGIFAVALTLLAFDVPDMLAMGMGAHQLLVSLLAYGVSALVVVVYWFKLRRLLGLCRYLHVPQLVLLAQAMLTICLYPRLASLAVLYGQQPGTIFALTPGDLANTTLLLVLFLFDGLCLLFACSLSTRHYARTADRLFISQGVWVQLLGLAVLAVMAFLELFEPWFNGQYVFLVPIVLLIEEFVLAFRLKLMRGA